MKRTKQKAARQVNLSDYCVVSSKPEERLSAFERMTLTEGEDLERALLRIAKQMESVTLDSHKIQPHFDIPQFEYFEHAASYYGECAKHPKAFFIAPDRLPSVVERPVHGLYDGEIVDISFPSLFIPRFPGHENRYFSYEANRTVHARVWRHSFRARGLIFAIHGWTMGDQRINSLAFLPGVFYKRGFDVALIELPFHGRRAAGEKGTVPLFPTTDVILTNEAIAQAICDLRVLKRYLAPVTVMPTGWLGVSLGAYVGALWSGLDAHDFAIPVVPLSSMVEPAWEVLIAHASFETLRDQGLTQEKLQKIYRVHTPLNYPPKLRKNTSFIVGGLADKMVSPRQVKLLFDHWRGVEAVIRWYRGGHAASLKRTRAFADIERFISLVCERFSPTRDS